MPPRDPATVEEEARKEEQAEPGSAEAIAEDVDAEDEQANLSLAAMEAALKPQVLKTLEEIAHAYEELQTMQSARLGAALSDARSFARSSLRGQPAPTYAGWRDVPATRRTSIIAVTPHLPDLDRRIWSMTKSVLESDMNPVSMNHTEKTQRESNRWR